MIDPFSLKFTLLSFMKLMYPNFNVFSKHNTLCSLMNSRTIRARLIVMLMTSASTHRPKLCIDCGSLIAHGRLTTINISIRSYLTAIDYKIVQLLAQNDSHKSFIVICLIYSSHLQPFKTWQRHINNSTKCCSRCFKYLQVYNEIL